MIKFIKASLLIILFLNTLLGNAQHKIYGTLLSASDSTAVAGVRIIVNHGQWTTSTDSLGRFEINDLPDGKYSIHTEDTSFKPFKQVVVVKGKDERVTLKIVPDVKTHEEIVIEGKNREEGYMRGVENMGIYEGKKSEVIIPEKLVANLATNNARQVYARVPGLNIWENDGAGLQLSIGGRGLDPNRTANFNVRQNGYDISADALGYPESYYTPPVEAIDRIQIVRGAASLQYGTQFGGLLNFMLKKPVKDKKIQLIARQSTGSFGFYNTFTSLGGTVKKFGYYTYFQYKRADGWRPNSHFDNVNFYTTLQYKFTEKTTAAVDLTLMDYLAQQPGGLSDDMFEKNPRQSNRERNWFKVKWNMLAVHFNHKFNTKNEFNLRMFGLAAYRYSIGFRPYRVATVDDNSERDLIKGEFKNWGAEARYLKRYVIGTKQFVLLTGVRYYHGFNKATQGQGSTGREADFNYTANNIMTYDYSFPNRNLALFAENIIYLSDKVSVTPGVRYEFIRTTADGYYGNVLRDLAGNVLSVTRIDEHRVNERQFLLGGIGISYKPTHHSNAYGNISQNYRSITFSDMRIANPSSVIDPNLKDERGYSADLGIRSEQTKKFMYDVSLFYLNYNNRIGEVLDYDPFDRIIRRRGNVGQAAIKGVEAYLETDFFQVFYPENKNWLGSVFINGALIHSEYIKSEVTGVKGNQVEFVPKINTKVGTRVGYKNLKASFQYTYLSQQFSDATNTEKGGVAAVVGIIPSYSIMDLSLSYEIKKIKLEGSINNLGNQYYFTRRATGYPGPGILPSDGRSFYLTLQVKI